MFSVSKISLGIRSEINLVSEIRSVIKKTVVCSAAVLSCDGSSNISDIVDVVITF